MRQIARTDVVTATTPTDTTPTTPEPPTDSDRPYSDNSPFNTPVVNPTVVSNSASLVSSLLMSNNLPYPVSTDRAESNNYDHPCYYPKASDPLATLAFNRPRAISYRVPLPSYAIPAGGTDHHLCVIYDGWEYNMWQTSKSGSTYTASIGGRMLADGPGIKTPNLVQQYGTGYEGGVEAKYGLRAGIITAEEMQAGQIDHALFVVVQNAAAGTSGGTYPGYNTPYQGNDRVRMGTRFWLDMSDAEIDASGAPAWEKMIAHAAHQYGIYVGDKGGAGFSFMLESSTPYNRAGVTNPWASFWASQGVRRDSSWGYVGRFSGRINWKGNLKVIAPPSPQIP